MSQVKAIIDNNKILQQAMQDPIVTIQWLIPYLIQRHELEKKLRHSVNPTPQFKEDCISLIKRYNDAMNEILGSALHL